MSDREKLSWLLILLAAGDVVITAILVTLARRENEPALTDRASTSLLSTVAASGLAILAGAFLVGFILPPPIVAVLFVGAMILLSIPNYVWVVSWALGRFR